MTWRRGLVLFALGAWFAALAVGAAATDTFPGDIGLTAAIQQVELKGLPTFLAVISLLGETWGVIASLVVAAVGLWVRQRRGEALFFLSGAIPELLNQLLKLAVARPRPPEDALRVLAVNSEFSFPSGHAVHGAIFFGSLGYLTWRLLPSGLMRTALTILWGAIIVLIGLSRVYLGAHWPSDVLGGYVFGAFSLGLIVVVYESLYLGRGRGGVSRGATREGGHRGPPPEKSHYVREGGKMFTKLHNVVIAVKNVEEATKLYAGNLGLKVSKSGTVPALGIKNAFLALGDATLELIEPLDPQQGPVAKFLQTRGEGLYMIELEVDNLDATVKALKDKGVRLLGDDPQSIAKGAPVFIHPQSTKGVLIQLVKKG